MKKNQGRNRPEGWRIRAGGFGLHQGRSLGPRASRSALR